ATGTDGAGSPEVKVFDARTGSVKFDFLAYDPAFRGGVRVAVGDVNGDGVPDIITGPGQLGGSLVKVFDGTNLTLLRAFNAYVDVQGTDFNSGVYVGAADVNGDGHADIITGPGAGGGPLVRVFDGQSNALLLAFNAYDPLFRAGLFL